jgi:hypothetical protein
MQSKRTIMNTLLTTLVAMAMLAGIVAPASAAARNIVPSANPYDAAGPTYRPREQRVCEENAFEADPSGQYAGYPCWARKAFAPRR